MSYFSKHSNPYSFMKMPETKTHLNYIEPVYKEDNIWSKNQRKKYVNTVNKWLNYDLIDRNFCNEYDEYRDNDYGDNNNYNEFWNEKENNTLSDDNDNYEIVSLQDKYADIDTHNDIEQKCEIKVKHVCKTIFNEILEAIKDSGFEINDLNQFKEDFIHYMYILSDNRKP